VEPIASTRDAPKAIAVLIPLIPPLHSWVYFGPVSIFNFALWAPETAVPRPVLDALQFWMLSSFGCPHPILAPLLLARCRPSVSSRFQNRRERHYKLDQALLVLGQLIHFTLTSSVSSTFPSRDGRTSDLCHCRRRQHRSVALHPFCNPSDPVPRALSDANKEVFPAPHARGATPLLWAVDLRAGVAPAGLPRRQHLQCQFQGVDCKGSERSSGPYIADQHDASLLWISPQLHLRHVGRLTGHVPSLPRIHRDHVCSFWVASRPDSCDQQAELQSGRVMADVWTDRERRCVQ